MGPFGRVWDGMVLTSVRMVGRVLGWFGRAFGMGRVSGGWLGELSGCAAIKYDPAWVGGVWG
jgi:hypothetical protein